MDHYWDESTWQDRAARAERERFGTRRIARDPDVERRDRLREEEEEERRRAINRGSPWAIGLAYYDQRDSYTRNASIEDDGYTRIPGPHPDEGSYAYHRAFHPGIVSVEQRDATLYEREAWPWLNYHSPHEDPYFAFIEHEHEHEHDRSLWGRLKEGAIHLKERVVGGPHTGSGPENLRSAAKPRPTPRRVENWQRSDARIQEDVCDALAFRGDLDASDIEVSVQGAEVTLEGTVTDRRSKRLAEKVAESVRGVRDVHNRLRIRHDDPRDAGVVLARPFAFG